MQISYRRDVHHNYLILSGDDQTDMTSYQIRMMMANEMDGLLSCKVHQMDQKMLFYYDITSKQPLQTLLEHQLIQKDTLELLLSQIAVVMETVREYLLSLDGLVLKPEMIYLDAERRRIWFCYYPGNQLPFQAQLRELSEYLLPKLEHKDRDAVMLGYIFYQKCVEETVTTDVFQELLHRVTASQSREDAAQEIPEIIGQENMIDQQDEIPKNREELLESIKLKPETAFDIWCSGAGRASGRFHCHGASGGGRRAGSGGSRHLSAHSDSSEKFAGKQRKRSGDGKISSGILGFGRISDR